MESWLRRLRARLLPTKQGRDTTVPRGLACQEVVELITDYLEGALLPEQRVQFEEHLAGCPGCRQYLEQVRLTIGMLRNLAHEPVFPETKEELLQAFRQWKER
ncbi:MAG TPA: zf-HC2 domain-containing protein [Ktedonobacteraceae bacterium]|jgi:predicted anti-sigma-YlaC factor YlaD|nr:zf-HC2 domain-containing protein [Ktedonobacteraceae bacterium]